jgi:hypothetical protein
MKDQLLNEGLTATENKHMTISDLKTGFLIVLGLILCISICVNGCQKVNNNALKGQIDAQNDVMAKQQADINELTFNINNLINNNK